MRECPPRVGALAAAALAFAAARARAAPAPASPRAARRPGDAVTLADAAPGPNPIDGPRLAPVTVEFFCALGDGTRSARAYHLLTALSDRHPRRLRIIYRMVGLNGGPDFDSEAAREAFAQGHFDAFIAAAFAGGRSPRHHELPDIARRAGMSYRRLELALADARHAGEVERNRDYQRRVGVTRVPGLLVNGVPLGAPIRSLDQLEDAFDRADARARDLLARGVRLADLYRRLLIEVQTSKPPPEIEAGLVDGTGARAAAGAHRPAPLVAGRLDLLGPHARGATDATVPVVFVCSFRSRYCAEMYQAIEALRRAFPEVRLVFKPLVATGAGGDSNAFLIHEAALCAGAQGAFWQFYDSIYERFQTRAMDRDELARRARQLGLDVHAFSACLDDRRTAAALTAEIDAVRQAGIRHTPAVVIGGRLYTGTKRFAELRALVWRQLLPGFLARITAIPTR